MNCLQNLHTHTTYCDGTHTPEEMIREAIKKGFSSLGFSGHSYAFFSKCSPMTLEGTEAYKKEIRELKEKYRGQIDIFCGLEFELYSEIELTGYDYIIGSTHYFKINGEFVGFDRDAATVKSVIDEYFDGNGIAYAKAYYEMLATLPSYGNFDIIGHFDLITKHCEKENFFDINSKEYLSYAFDAIDALRYKIFFFEVNTGAIARGYRTTPYPSVPITKRLLEKGFLPIVSSDCHDKNMLDCAFKEAYEMLSECGAKETYVLTEHGFKGIKI